MPDLQPDITIEDFGHHIIEQFSACPTYKQVMEWLDRHFQVCPTCQATAELLESACDMKVVK